MLNENTKKPTEFIKIGTTSYSESCYAEEVLLKSISRVPVVQTSAQKSRTKRNVKK